MKFTPTQPLRPFKVGAGSSITLTDCGRVELGTDEQITFVGESGSEYDVCRKAWGYYATPSLNGRLPRLGLRPLLVRNEQQQYFVMLVEKSKEAEFHAYLKTERIAVVTWLDETEVLEAFYAASKNQK